MSTKKIREALERLRNGNPESLAIAEDALEDLDAIEHEADALRVLLDSSNLHQPLGVYAKRLYAIAATIYGDDKPR